MKEASKKTQKETQAPGVLFAYRFKRELHDEIKEYLENRPFIETDELLETIFQKDYESTYITDEGIKMLMEYLGKCPRKEAKIFIDKVKMGELEKFKLEPKKEEK